MEKTCEGAACIGDPKTLLKQTTITLAFTKKISLCLFISTQPRTVSTRGRKHGLHPPANIEKDNLTMSPPPLPPIPKDIVFGVAFIRLSPSYSIITFTQKLTVEGGYLYNGPRMVAE